MASSVPVVRMFRSSLLYPFLFRRQDELVSVLVFEDRRRSPLFRLRIHRKDHTFAFQYLGRSLHIVAPERNRLMAANPCRVAVDRKQHQLRIPSRYPQFNPSLFLIERLVREHTESQLLGIKLNRLILVG